MFQDLKPYPAYDDSRSWEGKVPSHWRRASMRALAREVAVSGVPDEPMLSVSIKHGVTPQSVVLAQSGKRDSSNVNRSSYKLVELGDVAYNKMRAWQGAAGMSAYRGIVSPAYVVLRPDPSNCNPVYLHHLLRLPGYAAEAARWSYGISSDQWSLRPEHFRLVPVALPPLEEQEAIVTYLAHAHQRINKAIAAKQRMVGLLNEQIGLVREHAMGRRSVSDDVLEHELLGTIPRAWSDVRLKWLVEPLTQGWSPQADAQPADLDEWGVVKAGCANGGRFRPEENKRLPATVVPRPELEIRDGDLLISRANTLKLVGSTALVRNPRPKLMLCDKIFRTHVDEARAVPEFIAEVLQTGASRFQIENGASGASHSMQNIGQDVIRELVVPLPPLDTQREILREIDAETSRIRAAIDQTQREVRLLEEFRTRLTADVVTGQLDVRAIAATLSPRDLADVLAWSAATSDAEDDEMADEVAMEDE